MENPYSVLGIDKNATDEQVKEAYRALAKKYHPDNYDTSPLKDVAQQKMMQINEAFDTIMNERRQAGGAANHTANHTAPPPDTAADWEYQNVYSADGGQQGASSSGFSDIRRMIQQNRLVEAEELLDGIPLDQRDAEWYFLKGTIYFSRGWLDDATTYFSSACRLSPNNPEYRAALNRITWQRQGHFGSPGGDYRTNTNMGQRGLGVCDMCSGLLCADCCCECMGGDLISCC